MKYTASAADVAEHFGVSTASVRSWVRTDAIPPEAYIRMPRHLKFDIAVLDAHFSRHQRGINDEILVEESDQDEVDFQTHDNFQDDEF